MKDADVMPLRHNVHSVYTETKSQAQRGDHLAFG
jgi:hypothetical protein